MYTDISDRNFRISVRIVMIRCELFSHKINNGNIVVVNENSFYEKKKTFTQVLVKTA
jgi:hypothetical protein